MIKAKLKKCAGFDGIEHEAYIYKNIDGKKYCKSCTLKLQPSKPLTFKMKIKPISDKKQASLQERIDLAIKDKSFYLSVWKKRFMFVVGGSEEYSEWLFHTVPKCEVCEKHLGTEPNTTYFHHILEKRNFPDLRHVEQNIAIVCSECHNRYETFPDKVPYLVKKRRYLLSLYDQNKLNNVEKPI